MMNSVGTRNNQINFTAAPEVVEKLAKVGISKKQLCSSYMGYSGPKSIDFPINPNLSKHLYPDVTEHYNVLLKSALDTVNKKLGKNKIINFIKKCDILCKNIRKGDKWDTLFVDNLPGRDKDSKVQYALFKDEVVSANHISNYIYSELLYHLGFKKWMAVGAAKIYSQGVINILFDGVAPSLKALMYKDTPQDQLTIKKAFNDFNQGNHSLK